MMMIMSNMSTREMKNFMFPSMNNIVLQQDPRNKKLFQGTEEGFTDQTQDITMIALSNHFDPGGGGYNISKTLL